LATSLPAAGKSGRFGDLKRRLLFLVGALIVFRIGAHIPVPGIDPNVLAELFKSQQGGILGMFNMFSGGALSRFTIFALGIMPYISASIIMQLMTAVSPHLEQLRKEGEAGRRKITQYTRYGTVFLALFQATGISVALESQAGLVLDPGLMFRITTVTTLVTGTMFLMWLGEQITERGIGNGISLIIMSGIVAELPSAIAGTLELGRQGALSTGIILVIIIMAFVVTAFAYRSLSFKDFCGAVAQSVRTTAMVMILVGSATAFAYLLALYRVPEQLTSMLLYISDNPIIILIILNVMLLVLGMIMDMAALILICTPIFLPVVKSFGMDPVQFGIILMMNLGLGLCTPPVGACLFVGCAIGNVPIDKAVRTIWPFYLAILVALAIVTFVPGASLALPDWWARTMDQ